MRHDGRSSGGYYPRLQRGWSRRTAGLSPRGGRDVSFAGLRIRIQARRVFHLAAKNGTYGYRHAVP
jgi:hypothetical protein